MRVTLNSKADKPVALIWGSNWKLVLVFVEGGKPENPEKNPREQGRQPTTNSTHMWRRVSESNPGHSGGRQVLSPLRHPCSPNKTTIRIRIASCNWMQGNGNIDQCNWEKLWSCMQAMYLSILLPIRYSTKHQHEIAKFKVLITTEAHNG